MNDDLERLQAALCANVPEPPVEAREQAVTAAMAAFDRHCEKIGDGGRGSSWTRSAFRTWLRGLAVPNSNTYLAFAGAAGFALVAVFVVYLVPLMNLPTPESAGPEIAGPTEAGDAREFPVTETGSVPDNTANTEVFPLPEPLANPSDLGIETHMAPPEPVAPAAPANSGRAVLRSVPQLMDSPALEEVVVTSARRKDRSTGAMAPAPAFTAKAQALENRPAMGYRDQGRDRFSAFDANPVKVVTEEPVSTFSIDVDTAAYGFVRASLNHGVLPQKDAVRVEELINYFPYDYPAPEGRDAPFAASVSVLPAPWNTANRLLHIGIEGYSVDSDARRANLVFLVDTSGSMQAPNKLPLLINSLKLLLGALAPEDRVAIVTYAGSASVLLEPTRAGEKARIGAALERLSAHGYTAGGEGIRQAYLLAGQHYIEDGVNRVILATDGDFNVGITDPGELTGFIERKRDGGVFLSVLGFGMGNYNDALMQRLAQNGNGNALYIDSLSEARKALVEEARSMLFPIAKDVKIQVEFNPAAVSEYRLIGYETRMLEREDFKNDKVDAGEIGAGHRVTAIYEFTPQGSAAGRIAPLRYQRIATADADSRDELAFLKIRYKLPKAEASTLITRPVATADAVASVDAAPADVRFAAAVAAFGQLLRGGRYTGGYGYDDVAALAQGARGEDPFGYRAEFVSLVRLAESAAAMPPLQR